MCSLAQICLDKYYRTAEGFCGLVEKEWVQFGHKFGDRLGLNLEDNTYKDTERSPIFLQFLDATWQIMQQFPEAFEFTEELLIELMESSYSGRFGTFLLNSARDREKSELHLKTPCVWPYLLDRAKNPSFKNPFYCLDSQPSVLYPSADIKDLGFWRSYYFKYLLPETCYFESKVYRYGLQMKEQISNLQSEVEKLQQELQQLKTQQPSNHPPLPIGLTSPIYNPTVYSHSQERGLNNNNGSSLSQPVRNAPKFSHHGFNNQPKPMVKIESSASD